MEGLMFKEWSEWGRSKVTIPLGIEVGTNDPLLIPIELSSSSELTEVSHDLRGAEGEAADVEDVLQKGEVPIAEGGDTEEEMQQPTPSPKLPPRQGKRDAVRGGAKEGAAKERPKRATHPRDFLKYERLGVPKALLVQEEEYEEKKECSERGRSKVTIPLGIEVGTNDPLLIPIELSSTSELTEVSHDLGGAEGEAADVEDVLQQGEAPIAERGDTEEEVQQPTPSPKLPPRRTTQGKRDAVRGGAKEGAAKERPKRAAHPRDFLKYERLGVPKALLVQEEDYEEKKGAEGEMEQICCFGVNLPHEPASMEEALAGYDREAWLASREDEFQSHMENETWTLTNLPQGRKALDCTWVLRVKTDAEGRLERRKTRLVIKGFQQREGIDFQEVFAPVAKAPTLRLLLAVAAVCGWKVEQMDVKTAFLYGVVDEEIYMKQPEGYDDGSG
ncbi:unnamed protein product, partial [Closterium sp. NIES-54]